MQKHTRIIALVCALLFPLTVLSAATVHVEDSIVGLGLDATVAGATPDAPWDLVVTAPSGKQVVYPLSLSNASGDQVHLPGTGIREAGSYSAFLGESGERISAETTFEVLPDTVDPDASSLLIQRRQITAGSDTSLVTVALKDRFGNALPGRPIKLVTSTNARVQPDGKETDDNGELRFTLSATSPGTISVRALDLLSGTLLSQQGSIEVTGGIGGSTTGGSRYNADLIDTAQAAGHNFGAVASFDVQISPSTLNTRDMAKLTVTALDANGQVVLDYTGTAKISVATDPDVLLPQGDGHGHGTIRFDTKNQGVKIVPLGISFRKAGTHDVHVEDVTNPAKIISGNATVTVTSQGGGTNSNIQITAPDPNSTVNEPTVTIEGNAAPLTNIQISGGTENVNGDTNEAGQFSISVPLDTTYGEYTFHVTNDQGADASLHLVRDIEPPAIASAAFSPDAPQEGAQMLLTVTGEPGLPSVRLILNEQWYVLAEDPSKPGVYQVSFPAPVAGEYQPQISAKDAANNETKQFIPLKVHAKELPKVVNLHGTARDGIVDLQWDGVAQDEAAKYRVYVGTDETNFPFALDTPDASKPVATVTGLKPATSYVFAVTTVKGDRESAKSDTITVRTPGIAFTVTPQAEALSLAWTMPGDLSLHAFLVEYGVAPDELTEKRLFPGGTLKAGEERTAILKDLLPGVQYFVKVTGIATTGDPVKDFAVTGNGTPLNDGQVHFAASDKLSFQDRTPSLPQPPIETSVTGLPPVAWWMAGGFTLLLILLQWHRRRTLRAAREFLKTMEARYHS